MLLYDNFFCWDINKNYKFYNFSYKDKKDFFSEICPELKLHRAEAASMAGGAR